MDPNGPLRHRRQAAENPSHDHDDDGSPGNALLRVHSSLRHRSSAGRLLLAVAIILFVALLFSFRSEEKEETMPLLEVKGRPRKQDERISSLEERLSGKTSGDIALDDDKGEAKTMDAETASKIASKWDNAQETFAKGGAWHQHPLVVKTYKERLAGGHGSMVSRIVDDYGKKGRCLSIGCGDGGIEIEMVQGGLCDTMRGIDLSPVRVARANENVPDHMKEKIEFRVENAETDLSGNEYDMVLFTHALHHIFDLEAMVDAIKGNIMKRSGILVLEEYVGPVRWQFPQHHLDLMTAFLKGLEEEYPHRVEALRQNGLWDGIGFVPPNAEAVKKDDPSETVRTDEIVTVLSERMALAENIPLGGNFFQWIFQNVYNSLDGEEGVKIVQAMLDAEMELIKDGKLASDYVLQVWKHPDA
mmetsp:Transcript_32223/g.47221  ORF Transcript_32223/g.47221 Transcript_32223/m.47221 type:complete len:416 (-) Transcript_32223:2896-4143(-)